MDTDDKRLILAFCLDEFRAWGYATIVEAMERARRNGDCLHHREGVFRDGTEYQIEINAFWERGTRGDVRVCGGLMSDENVGMPGGMYTDDVSDSFILRPDGTFVGE